MPAETRGANSRAEQPVLTPLQSGAGGLLRFWLRFSEVTTRKRSRLGSRAMDGDVPGFTVRPWLWHSRDAQGEPGRTG